MGSDTFTTKDGTSIFYKDWGSGQPMVFHHGWPLSADDWDSQMLFFLAQGYRVIAHDRRGHGRSTQTDLGNDMDTYAADCDELFGHLGLKDAIHIASGPFYGFNRPGATVYEGIIRNWWRQGMMGGTKAHYDCIKVFSETDLTEDLKAISVPVLVMHSEDDQIVPFADAGPLAAKLLKNGTLKVYKDFPHGMPATHADVVNGEILAFLEG
jgi:pimeloyl-ACP methyl ester carboxylesterase